MKKTRSASPDDLVETFTALPKKKQEEVFLRLVQSPKIRDEMEDLMDAAVAEARRKEKGRPLRDVLAEAKRKGK